MQPKDDYILGIQAEPTPFRDDRVGKLAHHKLRNVALRQMYLETEILFPKNHLNLLLCEFGAIVLTQRNVYGNVFPESAQRTLSVTN